MRTTDQFTITLPKHIAEQVRLLSETEDRTVSNMIKRLVELGIKNKG